MYPVINNYIVRGSSLPYFNNLYSPAVGFSILINSIKNHLSLKAGRFNLKAGLADPKAVVICPKAWLFNLKARLFSPKASQLSPKAWLLSLKAGLPSLKAIGTYKSLKS